MNSTKKIYFQTLGFSNLLLAFWMLVLGHHVYYFALGKILNKMSSLAGFLLGKFYRADYDVSEHAGLCFKIHEVSLEAVETIYGELLNGNPEAFKAWQSNFNHEKLHLYAKKRLSQDAILLITNYLILVEEFRETRSPVLFNVPDHSLNRLLIPWLLKDFPEPGIKVSGNVNKPWAYVISSIDIISLWVMLYLKLVLSLICRGVLIKSQIKSFKLCKEILWGIRDGEPQRDDDFMVDNKLFVPDDVLFYYRKSTPSRLGSPEWLPSSLECADNKGYSCVNFDRVPIPCRLLIRGLWTRYLYLPLIMGFICVSNQRNTASSKYMYRIIMRFLERTWGWDIFLNVYSPKVNLSQDEPDPSHISDTVVLNEYGSFNAGFQWADVTQWRATTLAYVGYNIYYAWGSMVSNYWQGNWSVDRIIETGYLWGHQYQKSLADLVQTPRVGLGPLLDNKVGPVISLLDEKPNPYLYTSHKMLYDFYRLGVEILQSRPNATVIAKPKYSEGIRDYPQILELIDPHVKSGRFQIWDQWTATVPQVMAVSDVVISMVMGSPYLEALCCNKPGFNFAPIGKSSSPIYNRTLGKVVYENVQELVTAVVKVLDDPNEDPWIQLADLKHEIDPFMDMKGITRLRQSLYDETG